MNILTKLRYRKRIAAKGVRRQSKYGAAHRQQLITGYDHHAMRRANVCLIGSGANCMIMLGLARKGVGAMSVFDFDVAEASNLNRQVLLYEQDILKPKAFRAVRNVAAHCTHRTELTAWRLSFQAALEEGVDFSRFSYFVCTVDNGRTRADVSTYFRQLGIPGVFCAFSLDAQVGYVFVQDARADAPCLGCKFPKTLYARTKKCFVPSSIEIICAVSGLALFAADTLIMPRRFRGWNYRLVTLNGVMPDECLHIGKAAACPLCGKIVPQQRQGAAKASKRHA